MCNLQTTSKKVERSWTRKPHPVHTDPEFINVASLIIFTSGNPCLAGTAVKQRWPLMMTPETLKLNDILPFQKVMIMENSSSKLLYQLFLGMARFVM
jgi:hypothetical protein